MTLDRIATGNCFLFHQSASKHGRRTFLYSPLIELVCNGQLWARAALRQLRSYNVEQREYLAATIWREPRKRLLLFSIFWHEHNRLTLKITITSLYWRYLDLLVYYSAKMSSRRQNGLSFVPKTMLTWVPREARGGLKAIAAKRLPTLLSLYPHSFSLLSVSFSQSVSFQHMDIVGLSQAEL